MMGKGRFTASPSLDTLPVGLVEYQHILPDGTPTNFYQKLEWEYRKYPHGQDNASQKHAGPVHLQGEGRGNLSGYL